MNDGCWSLLACQLVILCRTFPDAKPAEAACQGIKTLTKIMEQTTTSQTRVTVANFIAALCHTRPGLARLRQLLGAVDFNGWVTRVSLGLLIEHRSENKH